jgi:DNA polymerase-3 subunit epsilon
MPEIPESRAIDTLEISRKLRPGAKHTLDALCNFYGIDLSARSKHGALLDAELLARVYIELTGGRQIGFDLAADAVEAAVEAPRTLVPARAHTASPQELERHAAFVAKMKDPLWLA